MDLNNLVANLIFFHTLGVCAGFFQKSFTNLFASSKKKNIKYVCAFK